MSYAGPQTSGKTYRVMTLEPSLTGRKPKRRVVGRAETLAQARKIAPRRLGEHWIEHWDGKEWKRCE